MESRMNRRNFLSKGLSAAGSMMIAGCRGFGAAEHRYQLARESVLRPTSPRLLTKSTRRIDSRLPIAIPFGKSRVTVAAARRVTRAMLHATSRTAQLPKICYILPNMREGCARRFLAAQGPRPGPTTRTFLPGGLNSGTGDAFAAFMRAELLLVCPVSTSLSRRQERRRK